MLDGCIKPKFAGRLLAGGVWALLLTGCLCSEDSGDRSEPPTSAAGSSAELRQPGLEPLPRPRQLYLPDAGSELVELGESTNLPGQAGCPQEMVSIRGEFCIDRYEVLLVDAEDGRRLSPYYHPSRARTRSAYFHWRKQRALVGSERARNMPVPEPPPWQLEEEFEPRAEVRSGEVPNGYLDYQAAERACRNAGKRLCSEDEWVMACRGAAQTKFPYGNRYEYGTCNVFGTAHPAGILHDDPSSGHLDPRLNQVTQNGRSLLGRTGDSPACASRWGNDAVYDMVGNLDEWVSDPSGKFLGGFYARSTADGCDASISSHAPGYFDYSLGTRCCL